jgi:hypothetical protein
LTVQERDRRSESQRATPTLRRRSSATICATQAVAGDGKTSGMAATDARTLLALLATVEASRVSAVAAP